MLAWISNYYLDQPDHLTGAINRCKMGWSDHRDTLPLSLKCLYTPSYFNENQDPVSPNLSFSLHLDICWISRKELPNW